MPLIVLCQSDIDYSIPESCFVSTRGFSPNKYVVVLQSPYQLDSTRRISPWALSEETRSRQRMKMLRILTSLNIIARYRKLLWLWRLSALFVYLNMLGSSNHWSMCRRMFQKLWTRLPQLVEFVLVSRVDYSHLEPIHHHLCAFFALLRDRLWYIESLQCSLWVVILTLS